jgi:hypothetical protein
MKWCIQSDFPIHGAGSADASNPASGGGYYTDVEANEIDLNGDGTLVFYSWKPLGEPRITFAVHSGQWNWVEEVVEKESPVLEQTCPNCCGKDGKPSVMAPGVLEGLAFCVNCGTTAPLVVTTAEKKEGGGT